MSCPEPLTWSIYVDGELEADERRRAELHLVSCRGCRAEIVALQEEARVLSDALFDREPARKNAALPARPSRELAWGLPLAVAAVTVALTFAGLLVELRLPGVLDLFNPKRLLGAYDMVFDTIFMLRRELPALFELATSVAAVASVSALGCAAVQALSRRVLRSGSLVLLGALCLISASEVRALDVRRDQDTDIARGETVSESLACTGERVSVDGTVEGDLFVGAERFSLRGTVTGNVYVFGEEVEIEGKIGGSLIAAGEQIRISGEIAGATLLAGERHTLEEEGKLLRDALIFGDSARIEGTAARDIAFAGGWIEVRGEVARDLHVLWTERVALLDGARVGRNLRARFAKPGADVDVSDGAVVAGEQQVGHHSFVKEHYLSRYTRLGFYGFLLVAAAAAFVFGLLLYLLDPRLFEADPPDARGFFRSLGMGFVVLMAGPFAVLVIGLTVVGIPVAVLLGFILASALYSAYVLVAGLIGQAVLPPSGPGLAAFAPSLLVGVLLLSVAAALPFIGVALRIVALLFGLGCLFERVRGLHAVNLSGVLGGR